MPAQPSSIPISPLARVLNSQLNSQLTGRAQTPSPGGIQAQPARLNTLAEVSRPEVSRPEVTSSGAETTQELDALLLHGTSFLRQGLAEITYSSFRLHEKADWKALGFADEREYLTSRGYSESSWNSYLLLGERLSHLTLAEMREIPVSSARLLTAISAKLWGEFAWVEEARILKPKEFALLVKERRVRAGGRLGLAEPRTSLELQIPLLRKDEFERRMDSLRRREQLGSQAEVLDFCLRSAEKEPSRVGVIERLSQAAEELSRTWDQVDIRLGGLADAEAESLLAAKLQAKDLLHKIQKSLKELRRAHVTQQPQPPSLPIEVARDQNSAGTDPAQA